MSMFVNQKLKLSAAATFFFGPCDNAHQFLSMLFNISAQWGKIRRIYRSRPNTVEQKAFLHIFNKYLISLCFQLFFMERL